WSWTLTVSEWLWLLPFLGILVLLGYLAIRPFLQKEKQQDSLINLKIQKENLKVVNEINIEDLGLTKAAYCRCSHSKTLPACDSSHNKHNVLTGGNVGVH
uniref:Iron-binding zinc finger CDGSH type domain-containing protein n=1 Tax=Felis catus TaxID=9685 RepID=A0ABI7W5G9_FELCA